MREPKGKQKNEDMLSIFAHEPLKVTGHCFPALLTEFLLRELQDNAYMKRKNKKTNLLISCTSC